MYYVRSNKAFLLLLLLVLCLFTQFHYNSTEDSIVGYHLYYCFILTLYVLMNEMRLKDGI